MRLFVRCLVLLAVAAATTAGAQEPERWQFRQFQIENDVFWLPYSQPGDRFYTSGLRVAFAKGIFAPGSDESRMPAWLRSVRKACASCVIYPNLSIGQQIFTPEDLENPDPQPGERPWAAWLYSGFGATVDPTEKTRHEFELQFGTTGDAALGEFVQGLWHDLVNSPEPEGWHNQFGPDLGINGSYNYQHILLEAPDGNVTDWDFVPSVKAAVGTMMTYAGVGATFRVGRNVTDFPYSSLRPGDRTVTVRELQKFEIYGFVGLDIRAVAYNYFLEGALWEDELYTVDPERYVWDFTFGFTARYRQFNLTYAIVRRSEEFERSVGTDNGVHSFGSLSLTVGLR
jgi:lipid A 3-O-deacylase